MFLIGICIHTVFLFSIFDIYFKSPIVKNVISYQPQHEELANRLVLFIVDGLRAESFVNYTTMDYTRSIAGSIGRWGISETRVPTESRPGHVAVIGGFYEDPSAVAKGWKENPVDFDSIFNQSKYTWCWGTYDIIDIFTKDSVSDHIYYKKFDPYDQSFSTDKNTTLLDSWVFIKVKEFFDEAKENLTLQTKLNEKQVILFLHLLGTDTSGHTHKPKTENFLTTVRHVDEGIKEIEQIIRKFYNDDGKTTFLMTSDHGMTDWGSHGSGDEHETQTPYVLWGAGVKQITEVLSIPQLTDSLPSDNRLDINQADLTPLMATILSIPVPVNSIGKVPIQLLDMSWENKAKAVYSNARQLASQYDKKRHDVESNAISLLYYPFESFDKKRYEEIIQITEDLLAQKKYEKLIHMSEEMMHLSLMGLQYYHNYYQLPLLILVTLSFIGWIFCLLKILLVQSVNAVVDTEKNKYTPTKAVLTRITNSLFIFLCLTAFYIVAAQKLPLQYYLYFILPLILWWYVTSSPEVWVHSVSIISKQRQTAQISLEFTCYTLGSLAMGLSFTYRWMLSVPLLGMALWPLLTKAKGHLTKAIIWYWLVSCILLSGFTFMPVIGKQVFIELVILAGVLWIAIFSVYVSKLLLRQYNEGTENRREIVLSVLQIGLLEVSLQNIYVQSKRFESGTAVSYIYQTVAWIIALASLLSPVLHTNRLVNRIFAINTSILTFYLLLSVSHEGLFLVTFIFNLMCWIVIEFRLAHPVKSKLTSYLFGVEGTKKKHILTATERSVSQQDFRRAFFFLLYIIIAFFGTGNIASLNSFEVRWVTCFVTSFQPFLITALILLKTLAPFLCVACSFRAIQHLTKAPIGYLNMIVLIYSNIIGIQLLYYVKNTGSWLEIGTSISQFVIVQVITLFIVLINLLAKILTEVTLNNFIDVMFTGRKKYV